MEKDEQMYVNLTYDIQKGGRNRLFHEDYVGLVDSVVVDGKTLSACNETDLSSGEHKVCLNFKKGIELTTLKNFFGDTALKSIDDNNLDVSKVNDMQGMFSGCHSLQNIVGLKDWDVSKVKDMQGMFSGCHSLQNVDGLKDWDISKVENMSAMFSECSSLQNIVGLKDWDVSNVTMMFLMFFGCHSLQNVDGLKDWDVSKVNDMQGMFSGCHSLQNVDGLKDWNVSKVKDMSGMFAGARLNLSDIMGWNLSSVNAKEDIFNCAVIDFDEKEVIAQAKNPGNIIEQLKGEIGGKITAIYDEAKAKEDGRAKAREFYSQMTAAEVRNLKNGKNL